MNKEKNHSESNQTKPNRRTRMEIMHIKAPQNDSDGKNAQSGSRQTPPSHLGRRCDGFLCVQLYIYIRLFGAKYARSVCMYVHPACQVVDRTHSPLVHVLILPPIVRDRDKVTPKRSRRETARVRLLVKTILISTILCLVFSVCVYVTPECRPFCKQQQQQQ